MEAQIIAIIILALTTFISTAFSFALFFVKKISEYFLSEKELKKNKKREVFKELLKSHSDLLFENTKFEWTEKFRIIIIDFLLWSSDKILIAHLTAFEKNYSKNIKNLTEYEILFGSTILEFRKELGYKNRRGKITPNQVIALYKAGHQNPLR